MKLVIHCTYDTVHLNFPAVLAVMLCGLMPFIPDALCIIGVYFVRESVSTLKRHAQILPFEISEAVLWFFKL